MAPESEEPPVSWISRSTIGGVPASVQYAGPQGGYPGLDQINILIPSNLAGQGQVNLTLSVFTTNANTILLDFQ